MPVRIQLRRTKGWRKPEGVIVVSRPSRWGNPYRPDDYREDWPEADERLRRLMAVSDFRGLVEGRWALLDPKAPSYPSLEEVRSALAGKNLACWCPLDKPCHGDVLIEIANA